MNEEQAVLNFFSQEENLPLALSVAEHIDLQRQKLNNRFWLSLSEMLKTSYPDWQIEITEDRETPERLVGIHLRPHNSSNLFLRPMLEQQNMGGIPRIYVGLMWSESPTVDKKSLGVVTTLRDALTQDGYKNNESFLGWRWSSLYPMRKDFLLRLTTQPEQLMNEAHTLIAQLLEKHGLAIQQSNSALNDAPIAAPISLAQLHSKLKP